MTYCERCRTEWTDSCFWSCGGGLRDPRCSACRAELDALRRARISRSRHMRQAFDAAVEAVCAELGVTRAALLDRRGGRHQHGPAAEARRELVRRLRPALTCEAIAVFSGLSEGTIQKAARR